MRKTLLAASLAAVSAGAAADTRLTVYSGDFDAVAQSQPLPGMPGFALVRQTLSLPASDGTIAIEGLPAAIDAAGVRFAPRDANVRVTGQRFEFAAADQSDLLRRALGQRVRIQQAAGDRVAVFEGTLVSAGGGLAMHSDDGRLIVIAHYASFEFLDPPSDVHATPTLRFAVEGASGAEDYVLDYPTGGFGWRAEYVATVAAATDACTMTLSGDAHVVNRSGAGFEQVELQLVAGQPNRAPTAPRPMYRMQHAEMAMATSADAGLPAQAAGEYHAYTVPGRIDVPDNGVQRVPLLGTARRMGCTRRYETRPPFQQFVPGSPIVDPGFVPEGDLPVMATLAFENTRANGLGLPLPAGRVRIYAGDDFQGEGAIAHTPEGRKVEVDQGTVFDLTATRTRKDLALADDRLALTERIEVVVRNAKDAPVTVQVRESLPRWTAWEIVESSFEHAKADAQTADFRVAVPAKGEATLAYTVRYRWPAAIAPN